MTITGPQVKAARILLGWSQEDLAGETGLSRAPIAHFETERSRPSALSVSTIQRTLEAAGVDFVEGEPGVKLKPKP
jgi:transcriptional regulator with XRE-family HTH domain